MWKCVGGAWACSYAKHGIWKHSPMKFVWRFEKKTTFADLVFDAGWFSHCFKSPSWVGFFSTASWEKSWPIFCLNKHLMFQGVFFVHVYIQFNWELNTEVRVRFFLTKVLIGHQLIWTQSGVFPVGYWLAELQA